MKKILFYSLLAFSLLLPQSCDLPSQNVNPATLPDVKLRLILPGAISQAAYNQMAMTLRVPSTFMQQMDMSDGCIFVPFYRLTPSHFNNVWSVGLYGGVLKHCAIMIEKAREEGQIHYEGIAKVLMADWLAYTTLLFGDIPYTEAFTGEIRKPAFDSQEDMIREIFELLEDAITLLGSPAVPGGPAADDLIFGGDAQKWLKTAWALKARYHLQMSKRDSEAARKALDAIYSGTLSSLEEQADFQWGTSENEHNPLAKFGYQRPNTMFIHKQFAENYLQHDPRLPHYVYHDTTFGETYHFYNHKDPGSLHWSNPSAKIPIISYVEVAFLEAEALWRTGADVSSIQAAMERGIIASMAQVGLEEGDYQPYISSLGSLGALSREEQLAFIMTEAYKAYYGFAGFQCWSNYRRTGYPSLTPHPFGSHLFNPSGKIPQRIIYPQNETETNPDNVATAKARQDGGLMDAVLWVFK